MKYSVWELCINPCLPRSKCSAPAVHWQCLCSAILQYTARPLKCICCKHTAALQCRGSVHYTAVRSVNTRCEYSVLIRHFKGSAWCVCSVISILHMMCNTRQVKHNVLQGRVQCTLREACHWSARKCALRCTGNVLHFDLGIHIKRKQSWMETTFWGGRGIKVP